MLKYTGHPLVDVGVATITAFVGKRDPTQVTEADLDHVADYITREYTRQPLKSFLTTAFFNSAYTQPAFEKTPERRIELAQLVLRNYRIDTPKLDERCAFTGEPAVAVVLGPSTDLPPGRAFRQHIPLLTGEKAINFHPYGDVGLPVSGLAILAIQAFPLGCAKSGGRLLAVHSDNDELTLHFADRFLVQNRKAVTLAQEAGSSKLPEAERSHRTLLIETLLLADLEQQRVQEEDYPYSLTAYYFTAGQDVKIDIFHLPLEIMGFLRDMRSQEYYTRWQVLVQRAWDAPPTKKGAKQDKKDFTPRRNRLYEDLFDLPEAAPQFIRKYFLRPGLRSMRANIEPNKATLVSWRLTARFLWRVMNMNKERIEQIRQMGDRLAEYLHRGRDRFLETNIGSKSYPVFRTALLRANRREINQGRPPLLSFEPYIAVFELAEEDARSDWRLARDLVMIRMVERLYELGQLDTLSDLRPDMNEDESEEESV